MCGSIAKSMLALGMAAVLAGSSFGQPKGPSTPDVPEPTPQVQTGVAIYLQNKAPFKIYATTVVRVNKEWKTIAFQEIEPGQKVGPIAHTDNRTVYFHAHSEDRKMLWGTNDLFRNLNGVRTGLRRVEFPGHWRSFIYSFDYIPPPENEMAPMDDSDVAFW